MNIWFLFIFLICVGITYTLIRSYLTHRRSTESGVFKWFALLSFPYAVFGLLSLFWFLNIFDFSPSEFLYLYLIVIIIQTTLFFRVLSTLTLNSMNTFLLFLYGASIFFGFFLFPKSPQTLLLLSNVISLLFSIYFIIGATKRYRAGYYLAGYSLLSLLGGLLLFFSGMYLLPFVVVNSLLLVGFIHFFSSDFSTYNFKQPTNKATPPNESYGFSFIRYFIFTIVVALFVFISTIGIHEFSHVSVARFYDCDSRTILFEHNSYPYSEVLCNDGSGRLFVTLAGPLVPLVLGLVLLFIGESFLRYMALLIIGFNLLASTKDLQEIGIGQSTIFTSLLGGLTFVFFGIVLLAMLRADSRPPT